MAEPQFTAAELDIDTSTDDGMFDWLLVSVLSGRPVPARTAESAYRKLHEDGWTTPEPYLSGDHHPLWHELWDGNYHRMSSVMSEELRDVMTAIAHDYGSSVGTMVRTASNRDDLNSRLQAIRGIGPKTAEIFLREIPDSLIGSTV